LVGGINWKELSERLFIIYYFASSQSLFSGFRCCILKTFSAKNSIIHPSSKIWLPSNLIVGKSVAIGPETKIYNQGLIEIEVYGIESQGAHYDDTNLHVEAMSKYKKVGCHQNESD
jgi:hypothetical protein